MLLHSKIYMHVLKRSLSAHLMQVVTFSQFLFEWRTACSFYRKSIRTVWFFTNQIQTEFRFSAHPIPYREFIQFPTGNLLYCNLDPLIHTIKHTI